MSSTKIKKLKQPKQPNKPKQPSQPKSPNAQMQIDRGHSLSVVLYISPPIHFQNLF